MPEFALAEAFVRIRPDGTGFRTETISIVQSGTKGVSASIPVTVDSAKLKATLTDVAAQMEALTKKVYAAQITADTTGLQAKAAQAAATLQKLKQTVADPKIDLLGAMRAQAQILGLSASMEKLAADVVKMHVTIDDSDVERRLALLRLQLLALGKMGEDIQLKVTDPGGLATIQKLRTALDDLGRSMMALNLSKQGRDPVTGRFMSMASSLKAYGLQIAAAEAETKTLADAMAGFGAGMDKNSGAIRRNVLWWTRFGGVTATALHWIVSGALELTAVLVPAAAAATAWAAVWIQGAQNVQQHISSVYTATEAMANMSHVTAGQMLGLGHALQTAQNAANPDVYQALGGAIKLVNQQSGAFTKAGLAVGKVFDTFTAKLVYDFSSAGTAGQTMGKIFHNMVPDLTMIGQVFGNLGHALGLVAAQMPGLAEAMLGLLAVLLRVANDVVTVLDKFKLFGLGLFTIIIGIEEFMRWGGLLVRLMGRIGIATDALGPKFLSWTRFSAVFRSLGLAIPRAAAAIIGGLGGLGVKLGALIPGVGKAGTAMEGFAGKMTAVLKDVPFWQVAIGVVAVAALGYLIYKLATGKTAADKFAESLQNAVDKATNLQKLTVIGTSLDQLHAKLTVTAADMKDYTRRAQEAGVANQQADASGGKFAGSIGAIRQPMQQAAEALKTYHSQADAFANQSTMLITNAAKLATKYGTDIPGAMALATAAGVDLTKNIFGQGEAAAIAQIKIADLVQGYKSMGAPMSVVGNDMKAVAIQTGEQNTQVAKVTAAWTSFMQLLTGGTNGLSNFQNSIMNMVTSVATATHSLGKGSPISDKVAQFADQLAGSGKKSQTAWQNFDQVVGQTAPDLINWLTTAGSMGAISGSKFVEAAKLMIGQLLPFAAHSKTARAELSGLVQMAGGPSINSFSALTKWVGNTHNATQRLKDIIGTTTIKMSDMSKMAQNLGTVLQTELVQMMDAARLSTAGVSNRIRTFTSDLENNRAKTHQGKADRADLIKALEKAGVDAKTAQRDVAAMTKAIQANNLATQQAKKPHADWQANLQWLMVNQPKVTDDLKTYNTDIANNTQNTSKGKKDRQTLISDIQSAGKQAGLSHSDVTKLTGAISSMKGKSITITVTGAGSGNITYKQQIMGQTKPGGYLQFHAAGGLIGGFGQGDIVPAMLEPGEAVVPKRLVPDVAPFLRANQVPGFASGGIVTHPGLNMPGPSHKYTGRGFAENDVATQAIPQFVSAAGAAFDQAAEKAYMKAAIAAMKAAAAAGGSGSAIAAYAQSFATGNNHPYVWGGNSPSGWDCSGFTSFVYNHFGYHPPRTSEAQFGWAQHSKDQPGALVFFVSSAGGPPPGHVGISMGNGQMANAAGTGIGTIMSGTRGNMGFGIPPGGFTSMRGMTGGTAKESQLGQLWVEAGGPAGLARVAAAIAMAESGGVSSAHNPSGAAGLWQILGLPFPGNPYDPLTNARMAVAKWRDAGDSFTPWVTFVDGAYLRFMQEGGLVKAMKEAGAARSKPYPGTAQMPQVKLGRYAKGGLVSRDEAYLRQHGYHVDKTGIPSGFRAAHPHSQPLKDMAALVRAHGFSVSFKPGGGSAGHGHHGGGTGLNERIDHVLRFIRTHRGEPGRFTDLEGHLEQLTSSLGANLGLEHTGRIHGSELTRLRRQISSERSQIRHIDKELKPLLASRSWISSVESGIRSRDARFSRDAAAATATHHPGIAAHFRNRIKSDTALIKRMSDWMNTLTTPGVAPTARQTNAFVHSTILQTMKKMGLPIIKFDQGGMLPPGMSVAVNSTGRAEKVTPGGGDVHVIFETTNTSTDFDRFMLNWLMKHVRVRGSGSVQAAFGTSG